MQTRAARQPILILLAAAGLLLLIACANVATVLMGEASNREAELRARMALGESRGRLVRQLLTESIVLAVIGGALGTLFAQFGTKLMVRFAPPWVPRLSDVHIDARVLAAALAVSCATGLVFGIVPALLLSRSDEGVGLRLGGQSARGRGRSQRILIACEVALSMVLLVGAALLVQISRESARSTLDFAPSDCSSLVAYTAATAVRLRSRSRAGVTCSPVCALCLA